MSKSVEKNSVAVVYLSFVPYGTKYLINFIKSYQRNSAGNDHVLVILFNGFKDKVELLPFKEILTIHNIKHQIVLTQEKLDITSYFDVTRRLNVEYILFLNTYSEILHTSWLSSYLNWFGEKNIGVVGSTAAYGDTEHDEYYLSLSVWNVVCNLDLVNLKKLIFYYYNFKPRVSYHVRTNAFMVRREIFLELDCHVMKPKFLGFLYRKLINGKLSSLCFEHGNNNMTIQIEKKGLKAVVVNSDGVIYERNRWHLARTFNSFSQEKLLISDNQTRLYELCNEECKAKLSYKTWGKVIF